MGLEPAGHGEEGQERCLVRGVQTCGGRERVSRRPLRRHVSGQAGDALETEWEMDKESTQSEADEGGTGWS